MEKISTRGGMSLTTGFDVQFDFKTPDRPFAKTFYSSFNKDVVEMFCDEAQLPNVQSATGQISGRYLGEHAVQYPTGRMFTDVGMGFLCDAELIPLKFFNDWYNFIFGESITGQRGDYYGAKSATPKRSNRVNRLRYMNEYASTIRIIKTEPNAAYSNGRAPITYLLENAYPYAIDAVPLSYGSSQITRVNVNFYYSRHTVIYGDKPDRAGLFEFTPLADRVKTETWNPSPEVRQFVNNFGPDEK